MALARVKTWSSGEVLTASDLNAEFNNLLNNARDLVSPLTGSLDMNGNEFILDGDADTSITADTDDQIDVRVGGSDVLRLTSTAFTYTGSLLVQNSQSAAYTTVAADANKHILHPAADDNARTFTIDSNANVAYAVGTCITFVNQINTVTIAITSDTMTLAGTSTTGSRTLAANGIATALKVSSTGWLISGVGLT